MTNVPENKKISMRDFGTPSERITQIYISLISLYTLLKNSAIVRLRGKIVRDCYNFRFYEKVSNDYWSNCDDKKLKKELQELEILVGNPAKRYKIKREHRFREEEDKDGEEVTHNFLERDGKPVLVSMRYLSYSSPLNHVTDFNTSSVRRTELLDEQDGLAKLIFDEIKSLKQEGILE